MQDNEEHADDLSGELRLIYNVGGTNANTSGSVLGVIFESQCERCVEIRSMVVYVKD